MENQTPSPNTFTPVAQEYKYAGFLVRLVAYLVDGLIMVALGQALHAIFGISFFEIFEVSTMAGLDAYQQKTQFMGPFSIAIGILYYVIFWVYYDGASPGKKLMGIKVMRTDGGKITIPVGIIRYIGLLVSLFTFCVGFLMIIFSKKKQGLHDKIASTMVVYTGGKSHKVLGTFLAFIAVTIGIGFVALTLFLSAKIYVNSPDFKKHNSADFSEPNAQNSDKILSYAPANCGLTIPIPKGTDSSLGFKREWAYEELDLKPESFYALDTDLFKPANVKASILSYKKTGLRLAEDKSGISNPGIEIVCTDNTKNLTQEEYVSLISANKDTTVTRNKNMFWGDVEVVPIVIKGKNDKKKDYSDIANLAVTPNGSKLLYMRIWTPATDDAAQKQINGDIDLIVRNLKFRATPTNQTQINSNTQVEVNVHGAKTKE